jgi:NAD(P)-dependent dehydrogenase (short-subunit alcohol dehydrogenase family)
MPESGNVVVIGGTAGIGRAVAQHYARRGRAVVLSSRDPERAKLVAGEVGAAAGIAVDLTRPDEVVDRLAGIGPVEHLVVAAIERDQNAVRDYDVGRAVRLATLKLVGYTAVVHALSQRFADDGSVVLFGGLAKDRPYPGSTTVTTVNGGIEALVRTLALELAPVRCNAIHPGFVSDTPYWSNRPPEVLERIRTRTPTGRLATTDDIVHAVVFLLENPAVNGINLPVDGGWLLG